MENNNLENMTYYQLEEQLMGIILNIDRLDYNKLRYDLRWDSHRIRLKLTPFIQDKVKLYNNLKSYLHDIDYLIKFINGFNDLKFQKEHLKVILENINPTDYKNIFIKLNTIQICRFNNNREALYNTFIGKTQIHQIKDFIKAYETRTTDNV